MNHLVQSELIRLHAAELRRAADHHRLVTAARGADRPRHPLVVRLLDLRARWSARRLRAMTEAEAEPCSP